MMRGCLLAVLLMCAWPVAAGTVYRWVDEHGKVQFSDKPPSGQSRDLTTLDKSGRSRSSGVMSEAERAAELERQRAQIEQRRKDKALLQSFSSPDEIDLLRDRQLEALAAGQQTNRLRIQTIQERNKKLQTQAERFQKQKKPLPADLQAQLDQNRDEIQVIEQLLQQQDQEAVKIRQRAEADKARFIQLRNFAPN